MIYAGRMLSSERIRLLRLVRTVSIGALDDQTDKLHSHSALPKITFSNEKDLFIITSQKLFHIK